METDPFSAAVGGAASLAGGMYSNYLAGKESKRARQWSERMFGQRYQATVADLRAAGLNPALALGSGPGSVPGAATASFDDPVTGAVSTALQARAMNKQMELLDQQIRKTSQEALSAKADADIKMTDAEIAKERWTYFFDPVTGRPKEALKSLLDAEFQQKLASSAQSLSQAELARYSVPEQQAIARIFETSGSAAKAFQWLMPFMLQRANRR